MRETKLEIQKLVATGYPRAEVRRDKLKLFYRGIDHEGDSNAVIQMWVFSRDSKEAIDQEESQW